MKRIYYILFLSIVWSLNLNAQIVNIPDANFKNALINFNVADLGNGFDEDVDTNNDGEIQETEAEAVIELAVGGFGIDLLEGIQSFINIVKLNCSNNNLVNLELTQNTLLRFLACTNNDLISLDVTQNIDLETLYCSFNLFSTLDVSQNINLVDLNCSQNDIEVIDLTNNVDLMDLAIAGNSLNVIDIMQNVALEDFNLSNNSISNVDLSQNPNLTHLVLSENNLEVLNISQNLNLELLLCTKNQLSSIDLSSHPNIVFFVCYENDLRYLNLENGNNGSMYFFAAYDNPNLSCIQVDDVTYSNDQPCDLVNNSGWCKDVSANYSDFCELGIEGFDTQNIAIYPNPANNLIILDIPNSIELKQIKVFDAMGRLVLKEARNLAQIDVSSLTSGIFLVRIETESGGVLIAKFIKR